jgi:hypothetical protein
MRQTSTRLSRFGSAKGSIPVMAHLAGQSIHPATRRMKMMQAGREKNRHAAFQPLPEITATKFPKVHFYRNSVAFPKFSDDFAV